MQPFSKSTVLIIRNYITSTKQESDTLTIEQHEQIERYLPLNPERAKSFVNEWEGFVLSCLRRMRITDEEDVLYRIFYRALNALPNFRCDSKLSTWLYRITWREGVRHIKDVHLHQCAYPMYLSRFCCIFRNHTSRILV